MGLFDSPEKPNYSHLPERSEDKWWCPTCKCMVEADEVTFDERHDPSRGGCGDEVQ